jgi:hypothetical protein
MEMQTMLTQLKVILTKIDQLRSDVVMDVVDEAYRGSNLRFLDFFNIISINFSNNLVPLYKQGLNWTKLKI